MASYPISSWQIGGGKVEAVTDFIFLAFKITVDSNCSHEIKRRLLFGRKAMTNLGSILKWRDITCQQTLIEMPMMCQAMSTARSMCPTYKRDLLFEVTQHI